MRNVAVTEGDKVEAQIKFGWEVDAYPVNEIAESVAAVSQSDTNALVDEYYDKYEILLEGRDPEEFKKHVAVQAQIELGFERFLQEKNYQAIVNWEILYGPEKWIMLLCSRERFTKHWIRKPTS